MHHHSFVNQTTVVIMYFHKTGLFVGNRWMSIYLIVEQPEIPENNSFRHDVITFYSFCPYL